MKVGFVLLDGELTGGQVVALQLVRGVRAAGHDAVAVLPVDGPIRALLEEAGATVRITQLTRSYRVDQAVTLARLLSRDRIDIVDTHTLYVGNQLAAIAARLARIPLVVHSHIEERYHPSGAVRSAQRLLNRLTRGDATTVAVSGYLRDLLVRQGGDPGRIVVVHNGVALGTNEPPSTTGPLRLVCIARLAPVKGQEVLLEALRRVEDRRVSIDFVGEDLEQGGAYRSYLEQLARDVGVADRIRFLGRRSDVAELQRAAGGMVLPSRAEGFPLVVLEAMAEARAVIATAVGGTPEAVVDGQTGILVPPDDPDRLAEAIQRLASDPALRVELGRAGRLRTAERFTTERMVAHTLSVYADVPGVPSRSATGIGQDRP